MRLTAHWELKAVALVLAIALYIYTSGQVRVEKTVSVTLSEMSVRGLPGDYQVVGITPREFKVQLSVPTSRLPDLESETVTPRLELRPEQLPLETASWPLTSQLLRLPNDIRIIATEPIDIREVTVQLDRVTEGSLPVELPHLAGLPAGLEASVTLDVTKVRVATGGDTLHLLVRDHEKIRFQDIDLRTIDPGLAAEHQEKLVLTPLPATQEAPYRVLDSVTATVSIHPMLTTTRKLSAPIQVLSSRDLLHSVEVTLTPPQAALTIHGPENLLKDLKPEALTVFVRLADDLTPETSHELPVEFLAPPGLMIDPAQVRVLLVPVAKP